MKVLIIEDEIPAARRLARLVQELRPQSAIVSTIDSVEDAISFFENGHEVDLAFMDIQLADGLSFDIFSKVNVNVPVIFTTAYDQYAIKAFKVNSVDYLLKPIEQEELLNAIVKYESHFSKSKKESLNYAEIIQVLKKGMSEFKKRFLVKSAGKLTFVNIENIAYFFSDDGNSFLVTSDGDRFLLEQTIEEIESQVNPEIFFRINRKMMIALKSIIKIEPYFNNRLLINIHPTFEEEVVVSRQRITEFKKWLDS